jgi:S-DNA-T family DNA segregation ATPase FtsK/SpoIIIE
MPRKKTEEIQEYKQTSTAGKAFRFLTSSPVLLLIFLIAAITVIVWQWGNIVNWYQVNVFTLFGWGILLLLGVAVTIVTLIFRRQLYLLKDDWNRWLSGLVFILLVWGIISYFPGRGVLTAISLGGKFGLGILGGTNVDAVGILRLLGLLILGVFFISPRVFIRSVRNVWSWLVNQMKSPGNKPVKPVQHGYTGQTYSPASTLPAQTFMKKEIPRKTVTRDDDEPALLELKSGKGKEKPKAEQSLEKVDSTPALSDVQDDPQQAAQDVWKKYGESPNAIQIDGWKLPPIDILDLAPPVQFSQADNNERARLIEEALSSYGVEAKVVQINAGPTVTQFGIEPGWDRKTREVKEKDKDGKVIVRVEEVSRTRVKVDRIASLQNDLALALTAPSIRIEAPVPGKGIVGIEVPNSTTSMVSLRGVIESTGFQKLKMKTKLALALGEGAGGEPVSGDLAKMPHLLIAGATGSGKTVCLNTVICCLLLNNTPNEVRFIMIDPKRVELTSFKGIPHLAAPVIVETDKAIEALRWLGREMNTRYQTMAEARARNIEGFNKGREGTDRMPYLVLVIDELADLMMTGGDEVEQILCRLAQLARAVGIHLVVATQRPSVDVITGLIKANFPTRISFAVTSQVDSRTILDIAGAEKLLGSGDMLYLPTDASKPKRIQGCYVSDPETDRLVFFWNNQHREELVPLLKLDELARAAAGKKDDVAEDSLMETARELAREHDNISTSFLQRRLRIGYPRAARIMDQLSQEMEEWDIREVEDELDDDDFE